MNIMKKTVFLFAAAFIFSANFIFFSCKITSGSDPNLIRENRWDSLNIPDSRNCGADESTDFSIPSGDTEIAPGVTVSFRTDTKPNQFNFSSYKVKQLPECTIVKNFDFSSHDFVTLGMERYSGIKKIFFENCKFKGFRNEAGSPDASGKVYFIFNRCTFSGNVSDSYITLNNCKIGGFTSDAMNPLREFSANNLYVYDLAHDANSQEIHLDGIQIYGDQRSRKNVLNGKWISKVKTGRIHYKNVRFEIPSVNFGAENKAYVNACVMFQLEFSDVDDVSFENLYVNGGGKWFPLYMDYGKNNERSKNGISWSHKNLAMKNVMVSNNFGDIFYPQLLSDAKITNVKHHDYLFVTSVWKDENGTAHILVTNDTNSDKTFTIKTDKGIYDFKIPHCPSNWALNGETDKATNPDEKLEDSNGKPYTEYKFSDFPFDIEYQIPGSPNFILCFQDEEQIRYVSLDGKKHYFSEIPEALQQK